MAGTLLKRTAVGMHSLYWRASVYKRQSIDFTRYYGKKKKLKVELTPYEEDVIDINEMKNNMNKAVNALKWQYTNLLNAKLTPGMIDKMSINVNGKELLVSDLVQVSLPNPQTILLNFTSDKKYVPLVVKELQGRYHSNPLVTDSIVKVPVPRPSKELRDKLVKDAKVYAEKAKTVLRHVRQRSISDVRKKGKGISSDSVKRIEDSVSLITDQYVSSIDDLLKLKTEDLHKA